MMTEEQKLAAQEAIEERALRDGPKGRPAAKPAPEPAKAPDAPDIRPGVKVAGVDVASLSKTQILELLNQKRAEYNTVVKTAKEKGVEVPKSKKTAADGDRLMEFFNRVGYHTGMTQWALGRRAEVAARIKPVVDALGEGWDPEKHGEAVSAMIEGFREARIQTSFKSTSMPEKKVADKVSEAAIWMELQPLIRGLADFLDELLDAPGPTVKDEQPDRVESEG
jgi:hypothetical protein